MKERPELKPCPFCGEVCIQSNIEQFLFLGCTLCDYFFDERDAEAAGMTLDEYWNRRA